MKYAGLMPWSRKPRAVVRRPSRRERPTRFAALACGGPAGGERRQAGQRLGHDQRGRAGGRGVRGDDPPQGPAGRAAAPQEVWVLAQLEALHSWEDIRGGLSAGEFKSGEEWVLASRRGDR